MKCVEIFEDKNCAWCDVGGRFIYGKDRMEVEQTLKWLGKYPIQESETETLNQGK